MGYASRAMRLKECDLAEAATILIAVGDGVLADSLRFSLGLEGFDVRLCDEHSLPRAMAGADAPGCLVLDHDVFARMLNGNNERRFVGLGFPVILMVGHTDRESDCARTASRRDPHRRKAAARGVLLDTIRSALGETVTLRRAQRSG